MERALRILFLFEAHDLLTVLVNQLDTRVGILLNPCHILYKVHRTGITRSDHLVTVLVDIAVFAVLLHHRQTAAVRANIVVGSRENLVAVLVPDTPLLGGRVVERDATLTHVLQFLLLRADQVLSLGVDHAIASFRLAIHGLVDTDNADTIFERTAEGELRLDDLLTLLVEETELLAILREPHKTGIRVGTQHLVLSRNDLLEVGVPFTQQAVDLEGHQVVVEIVVVSVSLRHVLGRLAVGVDIHVLAVLFDQCPSAGEAESYLEVSRDYHLAVTVNVTEQVRVVLAGDPKLGGVTRRGQSITVATRQRKTGYECTYKK